MDTRNASLRRRVGSGWFFSSSPGVAEQIRETTSQSTVECWASSPKRSNTHSPLVWLWSISTSLSFWIFLGIAAVSYIIPIVLGCSWLDPTIGFPCLCPGWLSGCSHCMSHWLIADCWWWISQGCGFSHLRNSGVVIPSILKAGLLGSNRSNSVRSTDP